MKIYSVSASSLECFELCEWQWYLKYVLRFEDPAGSAATLGHIAHTILEIIAKACKVKHDLNSKIWNLNYLLTITYNHYYKKNPLTCEGIKPDKLKKVSAGIKKLLEGDHSPLGREVIATEIKFKIPLEKPEFALYQNKEGQTQYLCINGVIDRVDKINEDTIEIIDYKSGSQIDWNSADRRKMDSSDIYKKIQSKLYHFAAKKLYPWAKNVIVTFIYFIDEGALQVAFGDEDVKITEAIVSKRFRTIRLNESPQRIKPHWKCNVMCPFGKNGVCDTVWDEKAEFGEAFIENKYSILNAKK